MPESDQAAAPSSSASPTPTPPAAPAAPRSGAAPRPWWQRLARWLAVAVGVWLLLCGLAAIAVPLVLERFVLPRAGETLGRAVTAERLRFNPFRLVLDATGLRVAGPDGSAEDFVTVEALHADLSIASLRHLAPVLEALRIESPQARIARTGPARFDFDDIVERLRARSAEAAPSDDEEPARFELRGLEIVDGLVQVDDQVLDEQHRITDVSLLVPVVSNLDPSTPRAVEPRLGATLNGSPVELDGRALPFGDAPEAALRLSLGGLEIGRYLRLAPVPLAFTMPSGRLDSRLEIEFTRAGGSDTLGISGAARLEELQVDAGEGGTLVRIQAVDVELERLEPLASRYRIGTVRLQSPDVTIERHADGSFPIVRAFTPGKPAPAAQESPLPGEGQARSADEPLAWSVGRLRVEDGRVAYGDATVSPAISLVQSAIAIEVGEVGNRQAEPAPASLSLVQGKDSRLDWKGELDLAKSRAAGQLQASVESMAPYAPWFADALPATLASGEIGLEGRLELEWAGEFALEASDTSARVVDASLRFPDAGAPAVTLRRLAAEGAALSLAGRRLSIGQLTVAGANVDLLRDVAGTLNLAALAGGGTDGSGGGGGAADRDALPGTAAGKAERDPGNAADGGTSPWSVDVERVVLEDNAVRFRDLGAAKPVDVPVSGIEGTIGKLGTDLSTESPLQLRARIGSTGELALRGAVVAAPLSARLSVELQRFALPLVDPYVAEFVTLGLDEGTAGTRGDLELAGDRVRFRGRLQVDGLRSRERTTSTDTVRWGRLLVDGIDLDVSTETMGAGDRIDLGSVTLSDFFARILLTEDGRFNLQDIFVTEASEEARRRARERGEAARAASASEPAEADEGKPQALQGRTGTEAANVPRDRAAQPAPAIRLGGLVLERGRTNFTDRFIKPNYTVNLTDLQGRLSAMASDGQAPADVLLRGRIDGDAPVDITGRIDPLARNLFLDVHAQAKGIDLPTLSPYSVKYVGYVIEKGQLSVDVTYRVRNEQLEAENRIFLDQLTLGDKIDSPDAIDLPIQFALGLLKDGDGVIDLNLPISGSLDDPQFSIGGVIAKAFTNLLSRIVTAPFSALAAAFGGSGASGEELSFVEFRPGTAELSDASLQRLETIAKALAQRPALKLEVAGRVDPAAEGDAIRRERLEQQLRALKRRELRDDQQARAAASPRGAGREQQEARGSARVTVTREERPALLRELYQSLPGQDLAPRPARDVGGKAADDAARASPKEQTPGSTGQEETAAETVQEPAGTGPAAPDGAEMERRLLEAIEVDAESVRRLANRRADTVRGWLASQGKIDRERIFLLAPRTSPAAVGPNRNEPQCPARCAEFSLK
ncbi:MAG: DUF748 domain-containing protein [Burkholderiaceae bacterium]|nr:DUF748 domain-containing protein [Burkholderiaceae bacterium]